MKPGVYLIRLLSEVINDLYKLVLRVGFYLD